MDVEDVEVIAEQFEAGLSLAVGDEISGTEQVANMRHVDELLPLSRELAGRLHMDADDDQAVASCGEFILEALYVNNRLSKHVTSQGLSYRR